MKQKIEPVAWLTACGALILAIALIVPVQVLAGVVIGKTRIIYPAETREVTLSLKNTENTETFLVQSVIEGSDGKKQQNFVTTPPLFILKPSGENKLRVFLKTAASLPVDRESLFWMSVKAVPSTKRSDKGNFVQFSITNRIKLLYRPKGIGTPDEQSWKKITLLTRGDEVVIHNPTPFYMNIDSVKTGTLNFTGLTVAPGKTLVLGQKKEDVKTAEVVFINDFGGVSEKLILPVI